MKLSNLIFSLSIIFLIVAVSSAQSATIHVPADQPTIQAGIDSAIAGDTVLVADGTYTGPGNRDIDFGGKGIVLKSENGPDFTIIDCQGSSSDCHRGFYFHSGEDSTAVLDGFTIQGGYALPDDPFGPLGGGIYCVGSSPTISNNSIIGNTAFYGGGIACLDNSSPTISDNTISENSASFGGGGIYCSSSNPTISNNTISENAASFGGGGIYCSSSNPTINNNTISGNSGGGIDCQFNSNPTISNNNIISNSGSGINCSSSSPTISNNTISGNSGGGISCSNSNPTISNNNIIGNSGSGINCSSSSPTISNNSINGNSAERGGGIDCQFNSNPTISNNNISGNSAESDGGGIYCSSSNPTISHNSISGNSANEGGGIYCRGSSPSISNNIISGNSAERGGGIFCSGSSPTISNNTISGNSASTNGAGLFLKLSSSPSVENSIFAFNSGSEAIFCPFGSNLSLTCCDVYGNEGGDWVGCIEDQEGMSNNFSIDPLFCDTATGDYHLSSFSPCLVQYSPCGALVGALGEGCEDLHVCADANGDSLVNVDDVDFLMNFYFYGGATPIPYIASDLNCDGSVNIADITYLAAYINGTGAAPCCVE